MPMPALGSVAQALYDELAPMQYDEVKNDYPLAKFLGGLGVMIQVIDDYARDQVVGADFAPGWSQLLDLSRCPTAALEWLAQFAGVALTAGLSDAQWRSQISAVGGWNRGTPATIAAAAGLYLTGNKTVIFRERDSIACPTEPAYGLTVITFTSETPNPAATQAAILAQKPAGIVLNYETLVGQDFEQLYLNNPSFQSVFTTYTTFQGVLDDDPGH